MKKKKKVIITYGTFDLFHIGHLRLLKRLKKMGDVLYVGISTDKFNQKKNKKTIIPYKQRAKIVASIKYVDGVFPEKKWNQKKKDIKKYKADILVMGDDWKKKFDYLKPLCEVKYIKRTKNISSTNIKNKLKDISTISKEDIYNLFDVIDRLKKDLN